MEAFAAAGSEKQRQVSRCVEPMRKDWPKARECHPRVNTVEMGEQTEQVVHFETADQTESIEYLMSLDTTKSKTVMTGMVLLLEDSEAFEHVCPKNFASCFPLVDEDSLLVGADGGELNTFGEFTIGMTMMDDSMALIKFKVMSVARPILSVSKLG